MRASWAYLPAGLVIWAGAYRSGVHPTLAGVVIGLLTPVQVWQGREDVSPVDRLQHSLHPWVAYVIMPVFALANAGVTLGAAPLDGPGAPVLLGVALGLVVGKPVGVVALSWLAVRLRVAALPVGVRWLEVLVVGVVAGIGFTMALFIASLAFPDKGRCSRWRSWASSPPRRWPVWPALPPVTCCWRPRPRPAPPATPPRRRPPLRSERPSPGAGGPHSGNSHWATGWSSVTDRSRK